MDNWRKFESLLGLLAGQILLLAVEGAGFALVPVACATGGHWMLFAVMTAGVVLTAAVAALSWHSWRKAGASYEDESDNPDGHARFMGLAGVCISLLSFTVILAQGIATLILGPCA